MNPIFQRFGVKNNQNKSNNLVSQLMSLRNNPGGILDILLQNNKIDQRQYQDLQQYKNNPQAIVQYLINNGKSVEINQAQKMADKIK